MGKRAATSTSSPKRKAKAKAKNTSKPVRARGKNKAQPPVVPSHSGIKTFLTQPHASATDAAASTASTTTVSSSSAHSGIATAVKSKASPSKKEHDVEVGDGVLVADPSHFWKSDHDRGHLL